MSPDELKNWEQIKPEEDSQAKAAAFQLVPLSPSSPSVSISELSVGTLADRALAHMLDAIIVQGFSLYLAQVCSLGFGWLLRHEYGLRDKAAHAMIDAMMDYASFAIWAAAFVLLSFTYTVTLMHLKGRTLGKALFGLRVKNTEGGRPTIEQSIRRYASYAFSYASLGIPFVLTCLLRKGRSYHDTWSDTFVTRDDS